MGEFDPIDEEEMKMPVSKKQLKWLITMSGKANQGPREGEPRSGERKAFPKGAPDIDPDWFPRKAERADSKGPKDKSNPIVGPGTEPSMSITPEKANKIVQAYFKKTSPMIGGVENPTYDPSVLTYKQLPTASGTKNAIRKSYQSLVPRSSNMGALFVYDPNKKILQTHAKRPAGASKVPGQEKQMDWSAELKKLGMEPRAMGHTKETALTPEQARQIAAQRRREEEPERKLKPRPRGRRRRRSPARHGEERPRLRGERGETSESISNKFLPIDLSDLSEKINQVLND